MHNCICIDRAVGITIHADMMGQQIQLQQEQAKIALKMKATNGAYQDQVADDIYRAWAAMQEKEATWEIPCSRD